MESCWDILSPLKKAIGKICRQRCRLNICSYIGWIDKYWDGGSNPSKSHAEFSKGHKSKKSTFERVFLVG